MCPKIRRRSKRLAGRGKERPGFKQAKPPWVTWTDLARVWEARPDGMHVDHIIPLNHPNICGLNTPANLQYLGKRENKLKANSFDGTIDNEGWREKI